MDIWNSFRGKLFSLIGVFLLGMIALVVVSELSLNTVKINGTLYEQIDQGRKLETDLEPPDLLIRGAYLQLWMALGHTDPVRINDAINAFKSAEQKYNDKFKEFDASPKIRASIKDELKGESRKAALDVFRIGKDEYIKLFDGAPKPENKAIAADLLRGRIKDAYDRHEKATLDLVGSLKKDIASVEQEAKASVAYWTNILIATSVIVVIVGISFGLYMVRSIVRPTEHLLRQMQTMASGGGDLTARIPIESNDELGQLSGYINQVIKNLHDLVVNVRESSLSLFTSTTEIAATSKEQEMTMQNLGASTNQIAAAVKEISATAIELSSTMNELNESGKQTGSLAASGRSGLDGMGHTMRRLSDGTSSIGAKLGVVREKANDINVVVTTITKVADQTNLLSINAAIEAEKAGEFGRGFLVVAREIRRLADQTAVATLDIENMVRQMQAAVSAGVMEMDKFTEEVRSGVQGISSISGQMTQIIEQVQLLNSRFQAVNEGTSHQSAGARQINDAMIQLASAVQQSLASLKEFHSVTQNLRGSAETLKNQVSRFHVAG